MANPAQRAAPFIAIGIAFVALGATGRRTFFFVGAAFILIGIVMARRAR